MKNNFVRMGLALMLGLSLYACKKDQAQTELADDAKSWYLKNVQKASFALISSKNQLRPASPEVAWKNAQTFQLSDGTEVLGVPLSMKQSNGKSLKGSYMLMIAKDGNSFKKLTVYNEEKEFFNNISKDKLQSAFNRASQSLVPQKMASNNTGRGKIMDNGNGGGGPTTEDEQSCVDWYLVESRYVDGILVGQTETYMYTTCTRSEPQEAGGGTTSQTEYVEIDMGSPVSVDEGHTPEETVTDGGDLLKVSNLKWKFHNAAIYRYTSIERGAVKVVGTSRTWHSLVHQSHGKSGSTFFFTVDLTSATPITTINNNTGTATMKYKLKFNISAGVYNQEHETDELSSFATWDENFVKLTN